MISGVLNDSDDDIDDDNETNNLGNFKTIHEPAQTKQQDAYENQSYQNKSSSQIVNDSNIEDNHVENKDNYSKLDSAYLNDYYNNYVSKQENNSGYQQQLKGINGNDELLKRLDNILHLLEEQQEEKTSYITEELILYVLGNIPVK